MIDENLPRGSTGNRLGSRELRLQQIRREAEEKGRIESSGVQALNVPFPPASPGTGYYGMATLKPPAWTWEVPVYFFTGGAAGAATVIASVAKLTGTDPRLIRDARWLAAIGGAISPALLVADLGMPSRFLHMLRVFKFQSPMSVGSWTLVAFSSSAAGAAFLAGIEKKRAHSGVTIVLENAAEFVSLLSGVMLSTYTGVLIGATAIPVWYKNVGLLPVHFATSGMATASAILELRGHGNVALNSIGLASALGETAIGALLELRKDPALKPLKQGRSGWLTRIGGLLSGPLPLILRLLSLGGAEEHGKKLRKAAAISSLAGSVVTRFAWVQAGKASAQDPRIPLQLDKPETRVNNRRDPLPARGAIRLEI
jgi:formate-dependent nitrite reductase membrane component NrfD